MIYAKNRFIIVAVLKNGEKCPSISKYHKLHHSDIVSVAKSLDADALEHLLCNLGSFLIGFYILSCLDIILNVYVICFWTMLATINTCSSHSSDIGPYDSGVHKKLHELLKYNYGTGFYIMDRLFGSYKKNARSANTN